MWSTAACAVCFHWQEHQEFHRREAVLAKYQLGGTPTTISVYLIKWKQRIDTGLCVRRKSVTIDIFPDKFKSQMICSNKTKSHFGPFLCPFIMLVLVVWAVKEKGQRGLAIVIQWLSHFGNHPSLFVPAASRSLFPYDTLDGRLPFMISKIHVHRQSPSFLEKQAHIKWLNESILQAKKRKNPGSSVDNRITI